MNAFLSHLMPISRNAINYIQQNRDLINQTAQSLGVDPLTISLSIGREIDRTGNQTVYDTALRLLGDTIARQSELTDMDNFIQNSQTIGVDAALSLQGLILKKSYDTVKSGAADGMNNQAAKVIFSTLFDIGPGRIHIQTALNDIMIYFKTHIDPIPPPAAYAHKISCP